MKFDLFRILSLEFLGVEWKDCYLKFRYITATESKQFTVFASLDKSDTEGVMKAWDKAFSMLTDSFAEGKGVSDGKVVSISKEDLGNLPMDVLNKAVLLLTGVSEDKKKV